jgi:hypothetical protein
MSKKLLVMALILFCVGCGKSQDQIDAENRAQELQEENDRLRENLEEATQLIEDARDDIQMHKLNDADNELEDAMGLIEE